MSRASLTYPSQHIVQGKPDSQREPPPARGGSENLEYASQLGGSMRADNSFGAGTLHRLIPRLDIG